MKKILVLQCHPSPESFCAALGKTYFNLKKSQGAEIEWIALSDLKFDPILRGGFRGEQVLEVDLTEVQKKIIWAEHIVWVYPLWWGSMPALLKGFLDRVMLPGFAFQYKKGVGFPEKLLLGRTAEIILTLDTPIWYYKWFLGAPEIKIMKKSILEFCGIKVLKTQYFGPIRGTTNEQRIAMLENLK
jgi:putative NADPH-quinone reductase